MYRIDHELIVKVYNRISNPPEKIKREQVSARHTLRVWADIASNSDYFRKDDIRKVYEFINAIPFRNTIIHGDYHPGNIMISDGELILIDMGDVSLDHPVIDLLSTYQLMSLIPKRKGSNEIYGNDYR